MKKHFAFVLVALAAFRCSTLAETAGGDTNLPSAGGGPFRKLAPAELRTVAPYLLDDQTANYRQPSVLPLGGVEIALFFVMHDKASDKDVIARSHALDGRTFYGATQDFGHKPLLVIGDPAADLAHPSVVKATDGIRLYYSKNGAIELARSSDGLSFTNAAAPVFAGPVDSASVAQLPDGTFRMLFATGGSLFEARSADGVSWQRDAAPVLTPGSPFDALGLADPYLFPRITAADRLQFRVLYTGAFVGDDASVDSAICFAARYEDAGPFVRPGSAAYKIGKHERAPSLFEWDGGSFLYVDQDQTSQGITYRAIAGGVAPAAIGLPDPSDYPDSP